MGGWEGRRCEGERGRCGIWVIVYEGEDVM